MPLENPLELQFCTKQADLVKDVWSHYYTHWPREMKMKMCVFGVFWRILFLLRTKRAQRNVTHVRTSDIYHVDSTKDTASMKGVCF